jgi:DNA-binding SARP family transcriptional activator
VRLLLGLADMLAECGAHLEAVDRLRSALQEDPTREYAHRQIMRLYGEMGARGLALRQFEICRELLREELNVTPDRETTSLYEDLFSSEVVPWSTRPERAGATGVEGVRTFERAPSTPFAPRV